MKVHIRVPEIYTMAYASRGRNSCDRLSSAGVLGCVNADF